MESEGLEAEFEKVRLFQPEVLLLDFHGTICSIKWEEQHLLPFVVQELPNYLQRNWNVLQIEHLVQQLRADSYVQRFAAFRDDAPLVDQRETAGGAGHQQTVSEDGHANNVDHIHLPTPEELATLVAFIGWQIRERRETSECLQLQRLVWQQGLRDGRLKVQLYLDVVNALKRWKDAGVRLCMFSSVQQNDLKLMLEHTQQGNILNLFEFLFDPTIVGNALQPSTYKAIANRLQVIPQRILYLTNVGKVAKTACQAGMDCALVIRPENARVREYYLTSFSYVNSFDLIELVPVNEEAISMIINRPMMFKEGAQEESIK